jgi:uncharacterized protein
MSAVAAAHTDDRQVGDAYTVLLRQPVPPGRAADVDSGVRELLATGPAAPGYLGSVVLHGGDAAAPELYVVLRFADVEAWRSWRTGDDVVGRLADLAGMTGTEPTRQHAEGIAGWFDLPGTSTATAPPKWKMAITTWCTIFPLLLLANLALSPVSRHLPWVAGLALGTLVTVPIMTWLAMPAVTRLLRSWLFGDAGD